MERKEPLWISHRGYHKEHCENTHAAFEAAVGMGFQALETDLRLTRDGHLVLLHDPTMERLIDEKRQVSSYSRDELSSVRLPGGEQVYFFEEFARDFLCCKWTLDIKEEEGEKVLQALFAWGKQTEHLEKLRESRFLVWRAQHERVLESLLPDPLVYARPLECWRAGLSTLLGVPFAGGMKPGRTYSLVEKVLGMNAFSRKVVESYRSRGARTIAFLPETREEHLAAVRAGFDEILTNEEMMQFG